MMPITKQDAWAFLNAQAQSPLPTQNEPLHASACNIHLNYTHQHINSSRLNGLMALADSAYLQEKIQGLMRGDCVNVSEKKPALHTALRASDEMPIWVDGNNIMLDVIQTRKTIQQIAEKIRSQQWLGFSGKPITDIVNMGIGGSDLGPRFCINAFKSKHLQTLNYHFVSDVDPASFDEAIAGLEKDTTLFIIASKSFSTQETLYNAKKAIAWLGEQHVARHCIAVTAYPEKAREWGIETIIPIWDWVGGRYSLCSAINLITAIAIGYDAFNALLEGAKQMDNHFHNTPFSDNLPTLLALFGIWNNNFLNRHSLLILTYAKQLDHFVSYIQQLDMESNGKSIDNEGSPIQHHTGPLIWGGVGNQAQHSYYQLLCQGTHRVAADFISVDTLKGELINEMCHAKIQILTQGVNEASNPYGYIAGNLPLNHLRIRDTSPFTIGALIALYEHKIFAQGVIWNINPFDQPGVESAKRKRKTPIGNSLS